MFGTEELENNVMGPVDGIKIGPGLPTDASTTVGSSAKSHARNLVKCQTSTHCTQNKAVYQIGHDLL